MAEDKKAKSNINQEYNNATTGLNLDQTSNQIPKGKLTYALNAVVENFDSNSVNYQNEPGNELCFDFPPGFVLIGKHHIQEQNKHIFFLTNPVTEDSEIGYMDNNDCIYHQLVSDPCLGWSIYFPIHKIVHRITNCSTEIYWPDNIARRYMDIENPPKKLLSGTTLCDPVYSDELDCNQLKVQPNFNIPSIDVTKVVSGGDLIAGTYQFAVQYSDALGNPYTSYYSVTNPTPIADPNITTVNFNYPVGKSITVNVSNLDKTGQFQYFNLAVIKTINAITSVELVGTYFIDNISNSKTYSGQNVTLARLSINDIFEKFPFYEQADDITTAQDILIWKGLTSIDRQTYQEIATDIKLQWETWKIPSTENYANEFNATNFRSYLRDEIYPFEIVFELQNGKQTDAFHIPGRAMTEDEKHLPDIPETDNDFIGTPLTQLGGIGYSPYWKIYNTAKELGDATGDGIENIIPHKYGEFAYWESDTEEYPCNTDLWGDLAGQKIRHHKFPDVLVSPIYESAIFVDGQSMAIQNDAVFPIGVKIDVEQIKTLIRNSSLTDSQKADIVGFKIIRGDRSTNKSIVAKGMLRNVGKYKKGEDDKTYLYPNYPYNDLNQDPFLLQNNNAYLEDCKSYTIEFNSPYDDGIDIYRIQHTDCNNNKQIISEIPSPTYEPGDNVDIDAKVEICSTTLPVLLNGNGYVYLSNYAVWAAATTQDFLKFCQGWGVEWIDPNGETKYEWIEGWFFWKGGEGGFQMNVKLGTEPKCVKNCDACGQEMTMEPLYYIVDGVQQDYYPTSDQESCGNIVDLPAIMLDEDSTVRQIFNSPETSFGQPFLGDVLKLESVMFGRGKAHFVEVKDNAKYKLLTYEAQYDALKAAERIAAETRPLNPIALFTAYQAYLTIFINGITRKNYAYSYNSIASYDYSKEIPNDLGIKQRNLDIAKYIIPGIQSVGDDYSINNYNRESSVFLKTSGENPLLFPHKVPSMLSGGNSIVTDQSRYIISETLDGNSNCSVPGKEEDISVVAYYASLKNSIPNLWGQIYTYDVVDTGFHKPLDDTALGKFTFFGGDTFIGRFAYKTKLPFFIDHRVNAPDDSDIFYDEIGNIAYPKYWHSARSILRDYVVEDVGTMYNMISYKAHNFDCPNTQGVAPDYTAEVPVASTQDPNRSFYDGYFYLFAYGIPSFYCESSYNLDLRQAFNNREGEFWPHVNTHIPDDWVQESFVSIANDNSYYYNTTYSKQNKENSFSHLPADWTGETCYTEYPFRAVYSDLQIVDSDNRVNNWLIYRALSYFDFPQNYGGFTAIDGIQNKAILARFSNKTFLYNSLLTIDTSNPQAAYVGNPKLFKGGPPIDFAETDLGYVGSQHKMLLKIPEGQITIDAKRGQVFLINGSQATDISAFGSGLNRFLTDHLPFEILRYFPNIDIDNHYKGLGLHGVFDSKYERIIITKLDYIPLSDAVKYDSETKEFYTETLYAGQPCKMTGKAEIDGLPGEKGIVVQPKYSRTIIQLNDTDYFCNKSWTLSFNFNTKSWISFHSYIPNWYIAENNFFYSGTNDCCGDNYIDSNGEQGSFDFIVGTIVPNPITTTTTTTPKRPEAQKPTTTKVPKDCTLAGVAMITDCVYTMTGIITIKPEIPCTYPDNLISNYFINGIIIPAFNSTYRINTSDTQVNACGGIDYINGPEGLLIIELDGHLVKYTSVSIGELVYLENGTVPCETVPDGWYFTSESLYTGDIYYVYNGVFAEIKNCSDIVYSCTLVSGTAIETDPITTTTTTAIPTTTTTAIPTTTSTSSTSTSTTSTTSTSSTSTSTTSTTSTSSTSTTSTSSTSSTSTTSTTTGVHPTVIITVGGDGLGHLTCDVTSYVLTANPSVIGTPSYLWSTGETTSFITVTTPDTYTVIVTDSYNGLTGYDNQIVTQNIVQPTVNVIATPSLELTDIVTTIYLDAGTSVVQGTASYLWSTGGTNSIIPVKVAGDYSVTVTDSENGCSQGSGIITVTYTPSPPAPTTTSTSTVSPLCYDYFWIHGCSGEQWQNGYAVVRSYCAYNWDANGTGQTGNVIEDAGSAFYYDGPATEAEWLSTTLDGNMWPVWGHQHTVNAPTRIGCHIPGS